MSTLRLTAPLEHDARAFTATDGGAWMELQLRPGPSARAIAMVRMGSGSAAQHVAAAAARRYRRGEVVTVYAAGWTVDYYANAIKLEVGIGDVDLPPSGIDRLSPEPTTAQAHP